MSWIADADESAFPAAAAAFARDRVALGYVANYTKALARRPAVLEAWRGLNAAVKTSMDPRRYELATLAAARQLRSSYCCLAHGAVLVDQFDAAPEVRALTSGAHGDLDPVDTAVRLAEKVAAGAADMTERDLAEVRALGLSDDEVLDVVLAAAVRCYATYRSMDPQLQESLTVGRPIAGA